MNTPIHFQTEHRASFQEIDSYGHLNTVHYLSYFITHRFTALRERFGFDLKKIADIEIAFYTKSLDMSFMRPVLGDQIFMISSHISAMDEATCTVTCEMKDEKGRLMARCNMLMVCVDKKTSRASTWPNNFMAVFYE